MCGFCGFINLQGQPVNGIVGQHMLRLLSHRGVDEEDCVVRRASTLGNSLCVFLGNRRLKIIDLSRAGGQPFPNENGTVWVTYNGEIYNFRELRRRLSQHGARLVGERFSIEKTVNSYEETFQALAGSSGAPLGTFG